MSFLKIRINYTENCSQFYTDVAAPLQKLFADKGFFRWTIARGWENGPHYLLLLDAGASEFEDHWLDVVKSHVASFLHNFPSAPCDRVKYLAIQERLARIESSKIDVTLIEENNTIDVRRLELLELARKYESTVQWLSVFDTEIALRAIVTERWVEANQHEQFVAQLMILLACVFPPVASDDPDYPEYSGFLSYYSNYLFWHHSLTPAQQQQVTERFTSEYDNCVGNYEQWMGELESALARSGTAHRAVAAFMVERFQHFFGLARDDQIHSRSPFPKQLLAAKESVSAFHQQFFFNDDGSAHQFSAQFSAYRWLLNIIYKTFPLLNIPPIARQKLNYALDRLQRGHGPAIARIRVAMVAAASHQPVLNTQAAGAEAGSDARLVLNRHDDAGERPRGPRGRSAQAATDHAASCFRAHAESQK